MPNSTSLAANLTHEYQSRYELSILKPTPEWARTQALRTTLRAQEDACPELIFGTVVPAPSTKVLFEQNMTIDDSDHPFVSDQEAYDSVNSPLPTPCPVPPSLNEKMMRQDQSRKRSKSDNNLAKSRQRVLTIIKDSRMDQPAKRPRNVATDQLSVNNQIVNSYREYYPNIPVEVGPAHGHRFHPYQIYSKLREAVITEEVIEEASKSEGLWKRIPTDLLDDLQLEKTCSGHQLSLSAMVSKAETATSATDVVQIVQGRHGSSKNCVNLVRFLEYCVSRVRDFSLHNLRSVSGQCPNT